MPKRKVWMGSRPQKCDLGGEPIKNTFIDGATRGGPWGILCPKCHLEQGVGLGLGRGQKYVKDGLQFVKTEG